MQGLGVSAYVHAFFQRVPGLIPMSIAGDCMLWAAAEFREKVRATAVEPVAQATALVFCIGLVAERKTACAGRVSLSPQYCGEWLCADHRAVLGKSKMTQTQPTPGPSGLTPCLLRFGEFWRQAVAKR